MNLGTIWTNKNTRKPLIAKLPNTFRVVLPLNNSSQQSKSYWGSPTWFLFHTLAEKVHVGFYNTNYAYIWNFIKSVCNNLPCPYCKEHARNYVNKISLHEISTKEKLKQVLYKFHNVSNGHGGSVQQPIKILDKYAKINTKHMFDLFESRFFKSYIGTRQFNDWTKNKLKVEYYSFYNRIRMHIN